MKNLKSISEELAACRAAFAAAPDAEYAWCCHHQARVEGLMQTPEERINYIRTFKPFAEIAVRLRNFRPVRVALPASSKQAWATFLQAREAYNRDLVTDDLTQIESRLASWRDYEQAWRVYELATARELVELDPLHTADWPCHTWKGRDIFSYDLE